MNEFAERYVQIESHNDVLQNLYVASHRLHATLDPNEVLNTIKEILINLVGGERFGIWMLDDAESGRMSLLAHEGLEEGEPLSAREQELSRKVLASDAWYGSARETPLAVVPLRVDDRAVGLIVIRQILRHKSSLGHLDQQILGLLSGQAATALTSARLYAEKSRKLETMKGFLDFIKTKT
jgi:GAF domain-containing protein